MKLLFGRVKGLLIIELYGSNTQCISGISVQAKCKSRIKQSAF